MSKIVPFTVLQACYQGSEGHFPYSATSLVGRRVTIENFAKYVRIEWGYARQDENHNWVEDRAKQTHTYNQKMVMPPLVLPGPDETLPIDIRTVGRDTLYKQLGLDYQLAEDICRVRIDGLELESGREDKGFRDRADFIARMTIFYAHKGANFMTVSTLWPEIDALILSGDASL